MGDGAQKRKKGPGGADGGGGPLHKKIKGGNAGKWKTPHHEAKLAESVEMGSVLDVGDEGIWVTFARGMRTKAVREFKQLCDEYGEDLYGIKKPEPRRGGQEAAAAGDAKGQSQGQDEWDIEASIAEELGSMRESRASRSRQTFSPVLTGLECLFFMKTMKPVQPGALVRKMCEDARGCPDPRQRRCKYINRLTPVFDTDKATDKGMERVARTVLAPWFSLAGEAEEPQGDGAYCTYAIRHNIRSHTAFKSDEVINKIASLVGPRHKVNLGNPDKVVLVEVFQLFCGISVVDGKEWEALKRYNVNALYAMAKADS